MFSMRQDEKVVDGDLVIRRMRDEDAEYARMVEWRNSPHVRRRWDPDDPPMTLASARAEHGPDTQPDAPGTACIVELDGEPIGFIQFYRWASYPDEAEIVGIPFDERTYGLDVFIGVAGMIGKGIGTKVMKALSDYLIKEKAASSVVLTTDLDNHAAIRCYEKAGFRKVKEVLDTDTYKGERVRSWMMVKGGGT